MDSSAPTEIALEITPPANANLAVLLRRAQGLGPGHQRVNVIERPERQSSLEASIGLQARGFEPVWHLTNRGRSFSEVEQAVARAGRAGVRRALCIRGESKSAERAGLDAAIDAEEPKIREVVRRVRRAHPEMHVSVSLNHHGPRARVLANLWPKLDAGAAGVQTQVTFDLESLRPVAEELARRHPGVRLTPMLMPVLSPRTAIRVSRRLGVPIPPSLVHRLELLGEDAGWEHIEGLVRAIRRSPLFHGVALMTPMDPSPAFLRRLREAVR
jgi:5,10-methylenetetrahydrofolate reductase